MNIQPTICLRPAPARAEEFVSPPYDTVTELEARAYVAAHPSSFLRIDRPETDFPTGQDPTAPEVYGRAHELLLERQRDFTLLRDESPCYYLYELTTPDGHRQTGIVCACAVADYESGTLRRHEATRADKEQDRLEHIEATQAQTSPVLVAYPDNYAVDVIVYAAKMAEPLYDLTRGDGVRHRVWRIAREAAQEALTATFATVPAAYICDGHHRAAAAVRAAHAWHEAHPSAEGPQPCDAFLAVLFPASQMSSLAYNRVVTTIAPLTPTELLNGISQAGFTVGAAQTAPVVPAEPHEFGLYAGESWYPLAWRGPVPDDPAQGLDVSLLQDQVLQPLLGVTDPRRDPRMAFLPSSAAEGSLEAAAGDGGAAFWLYPTSLGEVMRVADAGELMPPKSTWFYPKLLSGLFIRPLRNPRRTFTDTQRM